MIKISVIIPVYNVEKYLAQCLDSVINQTYKNLEIICVNDASTDSSEEILREYAKKDNRIVVVNNEVNSKLGPTRNNGMKYATGEYVHFLDSDDWMKPDAYEKLANYVLKAGEVDIVHFLWNNWDMLTNKCIPCIYNDLSQLEKVININNTPDLAVNWRRGAWCKLYRRQFLLDEEITFNDYPCLEDIEHSVEVLVKAKSVYFVPDIFLMYRVNNPNSLMRVHHKHYDCAVKSYYTNAEICKGLEKSIVAKILDIELFNLFNILYTSFVYNVLKINEVRRIINDIDLSLFEQNINSYRWYVYYKDLMYLPLWVAKLKYYARFYLSRNLPQVHKVIVNIRRKFFVK